MLPGKIQWHTGSPSRVTATDHDLRGIVPAVLRLTPLAQQHLAVAVRRGATLASTPFAAAVFVIDFEVQRSGVVEDQFHIRIQQIRHAEIDRFFDDRLVLRQEIHGPIQVVRFERLSAGDLHIFGQPPFVAVELRGRGAGPVGHHGEQGAFDGKVELALTEHLRDDLADAETLPDAFE